MSAGTDNLKHIVVLMMENRSFDHMLGFAQSPNWPIDGLATPQSNKDSAGNDVQISNDAGHAGDFTPDPGHSVFDTLTQLYGDPKTAVSREPTMDGFVRSYEGKTGNPRDAHRIMKCFAPQNLQVLTRLAQRFCVCDRWFSSVPGPTFPNRAFAHGGTSIGHVDMRIDWHDMSTTIYERLAENNIDSLIYYHDSTMAMTFDGLARNKDFFGSVVDDFFPACENDDLPSYSFLEPRFANSAGGEGQQAFSASDQHPDHNVREGEALIQRVFNAIWSKPSIRNSTLLVIVYDEHGGLYDHVHPPTAVTPDSTVWVNDGISSDPSFDFTRLGVRVPAVLISPYIAPGTIDHTVYDHASLIATARRLLIPKVNNSQLTLRDKNANTFEGNLTLGQARNDKVDLGANLKSQPPTAAELAQTINEHLQAHVLQAVALEQKNLTPGQPSRFTPQQVAGMSEAQAAAYLQEIHTKLGPLDTKKSGAVGGKN
jgi:phospholipase C